MGKLCLGADAHIGHPAHWLALVRAVPVADATHTQQRASSGKQAEQADSSEAEVDIDVRESDLLRATRSGSVDSISMVHQQHMQVPELLCVAALVNVWLAECAAADAAHDVGSERV